MMGDKPLRPPIPPDQIPRRPKRPLPCGSGKVQALRKVELTGLLFATLVLNCWVSYAGKFGCHACADLHLFTVAGHHRAGIRRPTLDLVLLLDEGSTVGVFTQNRFAQHQDLPRSLGQNAGQTHGIRAMLINTGNANAGTGDDGLAVRMLAALRWQRVEHCPEQVLPFSTGVIMEPAARPRGR
jgi:hypothetical protein